MGVLTRFCSPHVREAERLAVAAHYLASELLVFWAEEDWFLRYEQALGVASSFCQDIGIAAEVGDAERGQAVLPGSEKVAVAAQGEIEFR